MKYSFAFRLKADAAWSRKIRERGHCLRCGRTEGLQAAHIERRRFMATRWDISNGLCLCFHCHTWFDLKIEDSKAWLRSIRGDEAVDGLRRRSRTSASMTPDEVMAAIES